MAAIRTGPLVRLTRVTSPGAYESVHCRPEGKPPVDIRFRLRVKVPPNPAVPEDKTKEDVCPGKMGVNSKGTRAKIGAPPPFASRRILSAPDNAMPVNDVVLIELEALKVLVFLDRAHPIRPEQASSQLAGATPGILAKM